MEEWKDVVGFEGLYEVSNHGNIRSFETKKLKKISFCKKENRPFVNLWKNNKQKIMKPHRMVLEAFVGECPNGMEGCHNDGNSQNNNISNLRWDTHSNNILDRVKHGTSNRGERCGTAKLTLEQVNAIRIDTRLQKEIAKEYGVQQNTISRIKSGVRWQHS